jgi:hypothetical protein
MERLANAYNFLLPFKLEPEAGSAATHLALTHAVSKAASIRVEIDQIGIGQLRTIERR